MNKLIRNIIAFSLKNKSFTFFWVGILAIAGFIAFKTMPIEAFPDVTNTQIIIVTEWNGRSAEEIERFVTTPVEIAMNSVQRKTSAVSYTHLYVYKRQVKTNLDVKSWFKIVYQPKNYELVHFIREYEEKDKYDYDDYDYTEASVDSAAICLLYTSRCV